MPSRERSEHLGRDRFDGTSERGNDGMSGASKTPAPARPTARDGEAPSAKEDTARDPNRDPSDLDLEEKTKRDREAGDVADDLADFA